MSLAAELEGRGTVLAGGDKTAASAGRGRVTQMETATTADAVAARLREEILAGVMAPGVKLRQEAIATRFGVSRIPVREALRRLEAEGLLEVRAHRGATVAALGVDDLAEITHLRALLEGDLAAAAASAEAEARARIAPLCAASVAAAPTPFWHAADTAFHAGIAAAARRPRQWATALGLRREIARYEALHAALPALRERWIADHETIAAAIGKGDGEAARAAAATHVRRAGAFLIARLKSTSG